MTSPKGSHFHCLHSKAAGNISGSLFGLIIGHCIDAQRTHAYYSVSHAIRERATSQLPPQRGIWAGPPGPTCRGAFIAAEIGISGLIRTSLRHVLPVAVKRPDFLPLARPDSFGPTYIQAGRWERAFSLAAIIPRLASSDVVCVVLPVSIFGHICSRRSSLEIVALGMPNND